jgi:transposase InsO family protein
VYTVIAALEQDGLEVCGACEVLGVSRSGYYRFQQAAESARSQEDARLQPLVQDIFVTHRRRYGARRIAHELAAQGETCGRGRTRKIMGEMGLVAIQPRSFKPRTTDSRHTLGYNDNLLLADPTPSGIQQIWVGDITYIPLPQKFAYLSLLMDLYSRRIVGWTLRTHLREELVLATLRQAIQTRQPPPGLIHHTDRGGQYAGTEYRQVLARAAMKQSMSRADDCYDNACMESCFGTLKTELELNYYPTFEIALKEITEYINYYNHIRRHSALDYQSPIQFERNLKKS